MRKSIVLLTFIVLTFISCSETFYLTEEDFKWMPYKGSETLVFKSNNGEMDTITLFKKDTLWGYSDPQSLNGDKFQVVSVYAKHTDPFPTNDHAGYIENNLVEISKSKDNRAELKIDFSARNAVFYRLRPFKLDSLQKEKRTTITTSINNYTDVYVLNGEDWLGGLNQRSDYITKLFWSVSNGIICYEKAGGFHYELVAKY